MISALEWAHSQTPLAVQLANSFDTNGIAASRTCGISISLSGLKMLAPDRVAQAALAHSLVKAGFHVRHRASPAAGATSDLLRTGAAQLADHRFACRASSEPACASATSRTSADVCPPWPRLRYSLMWCRNLARRRRSRMAEPGALAPTKTLPGSTTVLPRDCLLQRASRRSSRRTRPWSLRWRLSRAVSALPIRTSSPAIRAWRADARAYSRALARSPLTTTVTPASSQSAAAIPASSRTARYSKSASIATSPARSPRPRRNC
jgi:hypothetical protein